MRRNIRFNGSLPKSGLFYVYILRKAKLHTWDHQNIKLKLIWLKIKTTTFKMSKIMSYCYMKLMSKYGPIYRPIILTWHLNKHLCQISFMNHNVWVISWILCWALIYVLTWDYHLVVEGIKIQFKQVYNLFDFKRILILFEIVQNILILIRLTWKRQYASYFSTPRSAAAWMHPSSIFDCGWYQYMYNRAKVVTNYFCYYLFDNIFKGRYSEPVPFETKSTLFPFRLPITQRSKSFISFF